MEHLTAVIGPLNTNLYLLGDPATREAIAIDTAIPCVGLVTGELERWGWTLKLIVTTHGHWDHTGDNAALAERTGARIAVHPADAYRLLKPEPLFAPFDIPPCVPAVELAEGGEVRIGSIRLAVMHTPGHTEGSVCLLDREHGELYSGDTLFPGGWGRVDFPGGSPEQMVESISRLSRLDDSLRVLPGHGPTTTIGAERSWMELVRDQGRLPF
jgi:hydroxyacylglutathione hydrolase